MGTWDTGVVLARAGGPVLPAYLVGTTGESVGTSWGKMTWQTSGAA